MTRQQNADECDDSAIVPTAEGSLCVCACMYTVIGYVSIFVSWSESAAVST